MVKKLAERHILLAAGGSGGHVIPAQCLADYLINEGATVHFLTDQRGVKFVGTLINVHQSIFNREPISLIKATVKAYKMLKTLRIDTVIGFGGYPSMVGVVAAKLCGVPIILHEQNRVMGRSNRWMAPFVKTVATTFPETAMTPKSVLTVCTGIPLREDIYKYANAPMPAQKKPFKIAVIGGSQGASYFSEIVPDAVTGLDVEVTHQCRPEDLELTKKAYKERGIKATVDTFFKDAAKVIAESHLVICRTGASTISEVMTIGRPVIMVPYPFAMDNHQLENAHYFADDKFAWVYEQKNLSAEILQKKIIDIMNSETKPILKNRITNKAAAQISRMLTSPPQLT